MPTIARISIDCMALPIPSTIIFSMSAHLYPRTIATIAEIMTPTNIGICGSTSNMMMPTDITAISPIKDINA